MSSAFSPSSLAKSLDSFIKASLYYSCIRLSLRMSILRDLGAIWTPRDFASERSLVSAVIDSAEQNTSVEITLYC